MVHRNCVGELMEVLSQDLWAAAAVAMSVADGTPVILSMIETATVGECKRTQETHMKCVCQIDLTTFGCSVVGGGMHSSIGLRNEATALGSSPSHHRVHTLG
jgi:hypothetical protein